MIKLIHYKVLMVLTAVFVSACSHDVSSRLDPWKSDYGKSAKIFDDVERQRAERNSKRSADAQKGVEDQEGALPEGLADFEGVGETYYRLGHGGEGLFTDLSSEPKKLAINFRGAEIADVVSAILGEVLHRPFALASDVEGQMNLRVAGRVSEVALVSILRNRLEDAGYRLSRRSGVFEVARTQNEEETAPRVGDGFVAVPILNTTPQNIMTLLKQTYPQISSMNVDEKTGYIYIWSNQQLRAKILKTIKSFDTNMLAGRQLMVVPLTHTDAERMMGELSKVYPQQGTTEAINYAPLSRLNAILLTGRSDQLLTQMRNIIHGLDRPSNNGQQLYIIELENAQAEDVASQLSQLGWGSVRSSSNAAAGGSGEEGQNAVASVSSGVTVVPSKHSNALIVRAQTEEYRQIYAAVQKLDKKPIQILIEATIIEVTLNDRLQFGVQSLYEGVLGKYTLGFSATTSATIGGSYPGFNALLGQRTNKQTIINALRAVTDVRVLSRPKVIVLNNRDARLQVGDEVPVAVRQVIDSTNNTAPTINSIDYQPTGVILTVTPHANRSGKVSLDVVQEVSRVASLDSTSSLTPTLSKRIIKTQIDVNSGQTAILGGLISEQETSTRNRVPLLGDLPLVGALFGSSDKLVTNTELLVFLTPRVFSGEDDSQAITQELMGSLRDVWDQRDK